MWTVGIRPIFPVASELSKSTSIYFGGFCQKWDENALLIQLCFSNWTYQRLLAYECLWMFMLADKNTLDVPSYLGWSNFDRYGPWELSRTSPYFARRKGVESSIILQLPPSLRRFTGGFGRQDAVLPSKLVTGRKLWCLSFVGSRDWSSLIKIQWFWIADMLSFFYGSLYINDIT